MALSGKGRHEKAVEEFSKVIEMNPTGAVLYKDRGTAYRKLGEYELALKDFEKAIEIDKNFSPAYGALALLHAVAPNPPIHNPNQAVKLAQKAVTLSGGNSPDMLENYAEVLHALNQTAAAVSALSKALAMDPKNREYQELLAKWQGSASPAPTRDSGTQRMRFDNLW
jgi:tetratricopeptide (TPR) repeat protein